MLRSSIEELFDLFSTLAVENYLTELKESEIFLGHETIRKAIEEYLDARKGPLLSE
jgi:hypothetical protein